MTINLKDMPFGQITGKVGNKVFFVTRQGYKMREYVIPVQPNSLAQLEQRYRISAHSQQWKFQSTARKRRWTKYGITLFKARYKRYAGGTNGHNAYVSVNALLSSCNLASRLVTVKSGAITLPPSQVGQATYSVNNNDPPKKHITGMYQSFNRSINGISRMNFRFDYLNFAFGVGFTIFTDPNTTFRFKDDIPRFQNSIDMGFFVMCSSPFYTEPTTVRNPEKYTVAATKSLYFVPLAPAKSEYSIQIANRINMGIYSQRPQIGQYVYLTLYCVNREGSWAKLHRQKMIVTAP